MHNTRRSDGRVADAARVGASALRLGMLAASASLQRAHRDERGTISVLTVIVLLVFTMILGMIINVGREVDDKIKLQDASDASTYSAGVVVARGMNAVAFTNHLLCEVFGMTAYLREGRDRGAEQMVPDILAAWSKIGPIFSRAEFEKFRDLGPAITEKVPLEQEVVRTFSEMTAIKAQVMLPALEYILGQPETMGNPDPTTHLIPQFQRAVVQSTPLVAQATMQEIAARHGSPGRAPRTQELEGVFWRSRALAAGESLEDDPYQRTLPLVDPTSGGIDSNRLNSGERTLYETRATIVRRDMSRHYLELWISDPRFDLAPFERETTTDANGNPTLVGTTGGQISAKMSQFANLWRVFTCGQLEKLLNQEFPTTNLPHMLRLDATPELPPLGRSRLLAEQFDYSPERDRLQRHFSFVGVAYWKKMPLTFPGMFRSPMPGDSLAFSQVSLFLPLRRYECCPWQRPFPDYYGGYRLNDDGTPALYTVTDGAPNSWDSFNQNWSIRLAPATLGTLPGDSPDLSLVTILSTPPPQSLAPNVTLPNLSSLGVGDINSVNTH